MAKATEAIQVVVDGFEVRVSSPSRELRPGWTKQDIIDWFQIVSEDLRPRIGGRPLYVVRAARGDGETFFQKRAPSKVPDWMGTTTVPFPSGRSALVIAPTSETAIATLVWLVNLGGLEFHTWPSRTPEVTQFDELRIDLDPAAGTDWSTTIAAAQAARAVLETHGLSPMPSWSGKGGIHLISPIVPTSVQDARAAALAVARELERLHPDLVTAQWWKEDRHAPIFCDFNQMLLDRTMAMPYSPREPAQSGVVLPISWDALSEFDPKPLTPAEARSLLGEVGIAATPAQDVVASTLESLLVLSAEQREAGAQEAPYPPHYPKMEDEGPRVTPSRAKRTN